MHTAGQTEAARPAAQPGGAVGNYISPSRLNLWLKCPLAFKFKYLDGVPVPTSPGLFLGQMVHAGLEHFYRNRRQGRTPSAAAVTRRMLDLWPQRVLTEGVSFASPEEEGRLRRQAAALVERYLDEYSAEAHRPLAVETALRAPLRAPTEQRPLELPLMGILDLVLETPEGPLIVDFKTAGRRTAPLEIAHEVQLTAYAWLFRQTFGRREAGLELRRMIKTQSPDIDRHRYPPRDERHFRRLAAACRAYLEDLRRGRFVFRPGLGCQLCDFRQDPCREWDGGPGPMADVPRR